MAVRMSHEGRVMTAGRSGSQSYGAGSPPLATLTYQSKASRPFSDDELHGLLHGAQARNRALEITGLLVYDEERFFQCLEGPAAAVDEVWRSIRRDGRHGDLELLGNASSSTRFFGDWALQLARPARPDTDPHRDAMFVAPAVVELLYRTPRAAPSIMTMLAPPRTDPDASHLTPAMLEKDRAALAEIVRRVAVPHLAIIHGLAPAPATDISTATSDITHLSQLSQLPRLLIAAEPSRAFRMIADAYAVSRSLGELCTSLLEPAARSLGDLWHRDDCSELDVTLGLCRIQSAIRRLDLGTTQGRHLQASPHSALLATTPGESHMLAATTNAEVLWQAGWDTRLEFPASDDALQRLVSDTWFDSLDLATSPALSREDWSEKLQSTIAAARTASRNPGLAITISGRIAFEQSDTAQRVGADFASRTAMQIESVMLEALRIGAEDTLPVAR